MFYGVPANRIDEFRQAIATIQDIYKGAVYSNDMLICMWRNLSFQHDQKFMSSFRKYVTTDQESSLLWRLHALAWAAQCALGVKGDFVECGVFKGFCSAVLLDYLDFQNLPRFAYLYDTFAGLPVETSTEQERKIWDYSMYDSSTVYNEVREKFSSYENVKIIRGIVPDSFEEAVPDEIAFLHLDMNSEKAEMLALEHLFEKVVPGGFIVLDDFGWSCNANQMKAELEFMNRHGHRVLELPTGQGIIIKHGRE